MIILVRWVYTEGDLRVGITEWGVRFVKTRVGKNGVRGPDDSTGPMPRLRANNSRHFPGPWTGRVLCLWGRSEAFYSNRFHSANCSQSRSALYIRFPFSPGFPIAIIICCEPSQWRFQFQFRLALSSPTNWVAGLQYFLEASLSWMFSYPKRLIVGHCISSFIIFLFSGITVNSQPRPGNQSIFWIINEKIQYTKFNMEICLKFRKTQNSCDLSKAYPHTFKFRQKVDISLILEKSKLKIAFFLINSLKRVIFIHKLMYKFQTS